MKNIFCFDQVRREIPKITGDNDVITINQQKVGVDLRTALQIVCTLSCENSCQDSAVAYVVDVVLAQLQFSGTSRK